MKRRGTGGMKKVKERGSSRGFEMLSEDVIALFRAIQHIGQINEAALELLNTRLQGNPDKP